MLTWTAKAVTRSKGIALSVSAVTNRLRIWWGESTEGTCRCLLLVSVCVCAYAWLCTLLSSQHYWRAVTFKLLLASSGKIITIQITRPHPESFWFCRFGVRPRICFFNKFLCVTAADGDLDTPLRTLLKSLATVIKLINPPDASSEQELTQVKSSSCDLWLWLWFQSSYLKHLLSRFPSWLNMGRLVLRYLRSLPGLLFYVHVMLMALSSFSWIPCGCHTVKSLVYYI